MMKLSDHKGDEAIELWADLLDPLATILTNEAVRRDIASGESRLKIAKTILKTCKSEAVEILTRIDPAPLDGFNIIVRLVAILAEIGEHEEIRAFFGFAEQVKTESESGGSVMENTEVEEI